MKRDDILEKLVGELADCTRFYRDALKAGDELRAKEYENAIRVSFEAFGSLSIPANGNG